MVLPILERFNELLDSNFSDGMAAFLRALDGLWRGTNALTTALEGVFAAARDAEARNERLTPDHPAVEAFLGQLGAELDNLSANLGSASGAVVLAALTVSGALARQLSLPRGQDSAWRGLTIQQLLNAGLRNYTARPAFAQMLRGFGAASVAQVQNGIRLAFQRGTSPTRLARLLRQYAKTMPRTRAITIARTLQLQTWRDATVLHYAANSHIVRYMIRIAALDGRTCIACVALHGTRLEVGQSLQDHYNGRCTVIGVTEWLPRTIETGEEWLRRQPRDFQIGLMGGAAWRAWRERAVELIEFVEEVTDPLFGEMIREASLRGILGEAARDYYRR